MSFKSFKYGTNRSSIRGFLAAVFRPFMSSPSDAPPVFTSGDSKNDVEQWHMLILGNELSSQCQLERVVYCKCTDGKEHEFLLLHFRHPTQQHAVAILVLDRTPCTDSTENNNGSSRRMQSSYIVSPSVSPTPARDSIFTTPNNGSAIESYLSRTYDQFKELCYLDFPASSARPSAIQVSVLLSALSKHSPSYHLYQYQCYWYAHTAWEALKRLFPDCHEITKSGGRSCYLGVKIEKADSVEAVCEQYHAQWARIQNAAEERRRAKEDEVRQLRMEERAQCQAEIDQATRNAKEATRNANEATEQKEEAVKKANEEMRQKEEAVKKATEEMRQKEEAVRRAEVAERMIEEAKRKAEEAERKAEEAERKAEEVRAEWQAEMDRMRAQLKRQAV
ncbi:uncharacterized protein F5891DRAFT_138778 [Suillus fuscotomentosus]|uniref:Uncharacterized protein n=1 Tax=Suillus fuscotomentosus TaxID=1912939 RepID=A0AAD4DQ85_9AGAM|nr:uncharacterized protein F5891DRAFT_138778 [Suillus fuscotomentosus]KAG1889665.1 hypothetical protein F5891DRAFT_138778 [Suillus fuscotomentosus]